MAFYYAQLHRFFTPFCCLFLLVLNASAQVRTDTSRTAPRKLIAGVPVLFYTPETRWGIGATGTCVFNWKNDSVKARPSTAYLGFAITQNKQIVSTLPYHLFLGNGRYQLYGEFAYNRYRYNFYGTGNDMPAGYVESYGLEFPRVRFTALQRMGRFFYIGPRYAYDRFSLFDIAQGGLFARSKVEGASGGVVSGPGIVTVFDSRDNIFYPLKGLWTELVLFRNDLRTGGSVNFTRVAFDLSRYFSWKEKNVIAANLYSIYSPDQLPFFQMGMLGGMKKMRGFYEGRFRDNNLILVQAEYRRWIKGIFGFTVFGSAGQVAARYDLFHHSYWKYTWGAGLRVRVDRARKVNLRIDAAMGNGKILPYFTIGEAF